MNDNSNYVRLTEQSVFVVGNAPSLQSSDLELIKHYPWLGMNAAYRYWEITNNYPTYYACLDEIVGISHEEAISDIVAHAPELGIKKLLLRDNLISRHPALGNNPRVENYDLIFKHLPNRVLQLVTTGSHSAIWMAYLGFNQILLLGVDANYQEHVSGSHDMGNKGMTIKGKAINPNYFFEDYQRPGDQYTQPNPIPEVHIGAWRRTFQYLLKTYGTQVKLFNGSSTSMLDIAPFFNIHELFKNQKASLRTTIEDFAKRGHLPSRKLTLKTQNPSFHIGRFIDNAAPFQIGRAYIKPLTLDDLATFLKKRHWKVIGHKPDKFEKLAVFSTLDSLFGFNDEFYDYEIVSAKVTNTSCVKTLANELFKVHDTVLIISQTQNGIQLERFPCKITENCIYVISFKDQRFWIEDFAEMLIDADTILTAKRNWNIILKRIIYRIYAQLCGR